MRKQCMAGTAVLYIRTHSDQFEGFALSSPSSQSRATSEPDSSSHISSNWIVFEFLD